MDTTKSPRFSKTLRQKLAALSAGISFASFICSGILWNRFMQSQPRKPNPALGFVYSMNNHGWIYYLSAAQTTQMTMLFYMFGAFALLAVVIGPHEMTKQPWEKFATVKRLPWRFFWGSLVLSFVILWLTSPYLALFLVSKGIIF